MKTKLLDKSFTVRQVFRLLLIFLVLLIPLYVLAYIGNAMHLKWDGVSLNGSPFENTMPEKCNGFIQKSSGTPAERTAIDSLLLRDRIRRYDLERILNNNSPLVDCLGFAVLGGIHSKNPGAANFTEHYLDEGGDLLVSIRVEYHKPFTADIRRKQ